jgi:hypothetical protein
MTTTKEMYEAGKAYRKAERDRMVADDVDEAKMPLQLLDMADRLVTAIERIADALESGSGREVEYHPDGSIKRAKIG